MGHRKGSAGEIVQKTSDGMEDAIKKNVEQKKGIMNGEVRRLVRSYKLT